LLPLWSRELARGLTRQKTARRCRASKLASGNAVASYRTPERFAYFHALPSATSSLNSSSPGSPTRPGLLTAKGCGIGCAAPSRARRHTLQGWGQPPHRRHLFAALPVTWRSQLLTESLLLGSVGTPVRAAMGRRTSVGWSSLRRKAMRRRFGSHPATTPVSHWRLSWPHYRFSRREPGYISSATSRGPKGGSALLCCRVSEVR